MSARNENIDNEDIRDENNSNENNIDENNSSENNSNDENNGEENNSEAGGSDARSSDEDSNASDHPSNYEPSDGRKIHSDIAKFLDELWDVDIDTLLPNAECPICRTPFSTSLADYKESRDQDLSTLEALPFQPDPLHDPPVRLPCTSGHVVGRTCMIHWTTIGEGKTCPLDREEMFRIPKRTGREGRYLETPFERRWREIETEIPIPELLHCFRNPPKAQRVQVDAKYMADRLASLLVRIVYHQNVIRDRHSQINWPWITTTFPRLPEVKQANSFRDLVWNHIRDEPLTDSGMYPPHIVGLLNPALSHVFALLYRQAKFYQAETIHFEKLAGCMQDRVRQFFHNFSEFIVDGPRLYRIATLAVDLWVTQELLMTRARRKMKEKPNWYGYSILSKREGAIGYFKAPHVVRVKDKITIYAIPTSLAIAGLSKLPEATHNAAPKIYQPDEAGCDNVIHVPDEFFDYMWDKWGPKGRFREAQKRAAEPEDRKDVKARVLMPNSTTSREGHVMVDLIPEPLTISIEQERKFRSQRLSSHSSQNAEANPASQNQLYVDYYVLSLNEVTFNGSQGKPSRAKE